MLKTQTLQTIMLKKSTIYLSTMERWKLKIIKHQGKSIHWILK